MRPEQRSSFPSSSRKLNVAFIWTQMTIPRHVGRTVHTERNGRITYAEKEPPTPTQRDGRTNRNAQVDDEIATTNTTDALKRFVRSFVLVLRPLHITKNWNGERFSHQSQGKA